MTRTRDLTAQLLIPPIPGSYRTTTLYLREHEGEVELRTTRVLDLADLSPQAAIIEIQAASQDIIEGALELTTVPDYDCERAQLSLVGWMRLSDSPHAAHLAAARAALEAQTPAGRQRAARERELAELARLSAKYAAETT